MRKNIAICLIIICITIIISSIVLTSLVSAVDTTPTSAPFSFWSWFKHIFNIQTFSVVGDSQPDCSRTPYIFPEGEAVETPQGTTWLANANEFCSSGYGLWNVFLNDYSHPWREYRDVLGRNPYGSGVYCSATKCMFQLYCCKKECSSNSDCSWVGQYSECKTINCDVWSGTGGYKCVGSTGVIENKIPYADSSYKYCSSSVGVECWYYPGSGSTCLNRFYSGTTTCPSSYEGKTLYSSKATCEANICTDTSWSPDTSTICSGTSFTQTSNCGNTKTSIGTKTTGCAGNCDQYGKSVGDTLYWCIDTQTVGITTCSKPPPARHTAYYCPNYGTKTENGIEICKNNLCNVQSSITKTCTDTDNGKNYQTKGSVTWVIGTSSNVFEDRCTTNGLIEYYCDGDTEKEEVVVCTCSDGKCTSPAICEETSKACTTSDGCAGTQYCSSGIWGSCIKTDASCGTTIGNAKTITWTEFYSISNEDFSKTNYRCKINSDCELREGYNITCKDEKIMADRTFKSYKEGCDKNLKWMDDTIEILYWICPVCPGSLSICGTITQGRTAWDNYFSGSKYCVAASTTWYGKLWEGALKLVGSLGLPAQYVMIITIGIIILLLMFIINYLK